jgi:mercuric ion transport protein
MTKSEVLLKQTGLGWLTLFASGGTLICCALPIILVTLGLGATVAAFTSSFPLLVTIAQHKVWVFTGSGAMLLVSGWLMYRPGRACPADPELGRLCDQTQVWNRRIYWSSVTLWGIGFFAAYLALPLRIWLDF